MAFEPLVWYCQPAANVAWAKMVDGAFGAYTPCAINSMVISISYLVFLGLCCYRIFLIKKNSKVQRFSLRSKCYSYMLCLLAGYCTIEPLLRLLMGISIFNLNGETGLAPYEATSSIIEATAWCSVLIMIGLETESYIFEFRWCVRFGIVYVLLGNAVLLNLVLPVKDLYSSYALYLSMGTFFCKVLFGILLLVYFPNLNPCLGYILVQSKSSDDEEYELLSGMEQIFPERQANIISRAFFGWITPLMQQGYKSPITENDVWKLDTWDQTETLIQKFHKCWAKETQRSKPWLLRALNGSLGRRFWWGGVVKAFEDPKFNRLLFAEAGKDFVDFLFYIMSLPVDTVIRLLGKQGTVGSIGIIYSSIKKFGDSVMLSAPKKDILLKPMLTISPNVAFLLPSMQSSKHTILYKCDSSHCRNVSFEPKSRCPCGSSSMNQNLTLVNPTNKAPYSGDDGGFVKGGVHYMIMDDLAVMPMSATSIITLLNKFNVKDVGHLKEKVITVGVNEGVELLRASMQSKTVLSAIFLEKKESSSIKSEPTH